MTKRLNTDVGTNFVDQTFYQDLGEDKLVIESSQDVEPILKAAKAERNEFAVQRNSGNKYGEWSKCATIPNIIVDQLMKSGVWFDKAAMKKWLNDPDNAYLRTNTGRV